MKLIYPPSIPPVITRFSAVIGLFLLLLHPCWAGEPGPQLNLKRGMSLTGRFVHEHPVVGFDRPLRSEGSFLFEPGGVMQWNIERPMTTSIVVDKNGLTQSVGRYALLHLSHQQMPFLKDVGDKLLWALNGEWKKLDADYIVKRSGNEKAWKVSLTPRMKPGMATPFQSMIATGGTYVEKVQLVMKQATDTIDFSGHKITHQ